MPEPLPGRVALARNAMATRFEILLHGENEPSLRAAGEEALDEIQRLEAQLSLYRRDSEIAHLNARAASEWVPVSAPLFRLLTIARSLSAETEGAFDITVGPLVRCWGFMGGTGKIPAKSAIAEARKLVGAELVELDSKNFCVHFARPGVVIDLGAIGKGYAIEQAAEILREAGITSAIIHGGTSTIYALGTLPDESGWKVAIEADDPDAASTPLAIVSLKDEALSVSAVWGKSFAAGGKSYGHIIDPRTGYPANNADLAAVILPSPTETDALSTALLTVGIAGYDEMAKRRPAMRALVMQRKARRKPVIKCVGIDRLKHFFRRETRSSSN
jgi:FAD:protein FMN transferase